MDKYSTNPTLLTNAALAIIRLEAAKTLLAAAVDDDPEPRDLVDAAAILIGQSLAFIEDTD